MSEFKINDDPTYIDTRLKVQEITQTKGCKGCMLRIMYKLWKYLFSLEPFMQLGIVVATTAGVFYSQIIVQQLPVVGLLYSLLAGYIMGIFLYACWYATWVSGFLVDTESQKHLRNEVAPIVCLHYLLILVLFIICFYVLFLIIQRCPENNPCTFDEILHGSNQTQSL